MSRRQRGDLAKACILGRGLRAAEVAESVCAEDQPLDRPAEVEVRQGRDDRFGAVERARGHPRRTADDVGGPLIAVLAKPDGEHAGHRQRRYDHPGDLVGAALGARAPGRYVDLADGLGVEERIADDGCRRASSSCPLTTGTISTAESFLRLGSDEATETAGG